jgi:hypothetical protein
MRVPYQVVVSVLGDAKAIETEFTMTPYVIN